MFLFYTILYLLLLYMGPTFEAFSPLLMIPVALLREGYLLFIFLYLLVSIGRKKSLKFSCENNLLEICILLAFPYIIMTNNIPKAVPTFLAFYSGPFLFCCITNLSFSDKTRKKFHYFVFFLLTLICFMSICLYFIQEKIVPLFPKEVFNHFYLTKHEGMGRLRLFGIGFHPTTTGFLIMYYIGLLFFGEKKYFLSLIYLPFWYFTNTRSSVFGIMAYIFYKQRKLLKILIICIAIITFGIILKLYVSAKLHNYLDPSALVHIMHLFLTGPQNMLAYVTGTGLGSVSPYNTDNPIIHLESDLYLYSIQVNIINLVLFVIALLFIIKKLIKGNTSQTNFLLFIMLTFFMGCIIFPLHSLRFTSNFVWMELAFYFCRSKGDTDVFSINHNVQWFKVHNQSN